MDNQFLNIGNDYTKYIVYQKTVCIYDLTYHFAKKYLSRGDRTVDQMVQAARSGKQNIAEGIADAATSMEMGIKLINGGIKEQMLQARLNYRNGKNSSHSSHRSHK